MKTVWSQKTDFYQFISNLMNFQNLNLSGVFVSGAETFLRSNWQTRNFLFFFLDQKFSIITMANSKGNTVYLIVLFKFLKYNIYY